MPQPSPTGPSLDLEEIYDVLQDRRRRFVLYHLRRGTDDISEFEAVIEWVYECESAGGRGADSGHDQQQFATILHHLHLPKLAEYGIIDYDWRSETIRYRSNDLLEAHLDLAERRDRP